MAKHKKFKRTLFFIKGQATTEAEIEESEKFEPGVQFRCASLDRGEGSIEAFDRLAGCAPKRYVEAAAERGIPVEGASAAPVAPVEPPKAPGPVTVPKAAPKAPTPKPGAGWSGNS